MMEKGWEVIEDEEEDEIELEENQTNLSGDGTVLKTIIREGHSDDEITTGCKVQVLYKGMDEDLEEFGSSLNPDEPFEYEVNKGAVIKGFDMAVASMKKGEKASFVIKPKHTGGKVNNPPNIPKDTTVIFEIELLGWHSENLSPIDDGGIIRHIIEKSDSDNRPNEGAQMKVHLTGSYNGRVFDDRELLFYCGEIENEQLILGVQYGLMRFREGETSKLIIKPEYGLQEKDLKLHKIPADAVIEYVVKLKEVERAPEAHTQDTKQNVNSAKVTKDRATIYFLQNRFELAARVFNKANQYLQNITIAGPTNLHLTDEPHRLKVAIFLNVALCFLKMELYYEARKACDTALEVDPRCVKAHFRRGVSHLRSGDAAAALEDFKRAHKHDPDNKAVINHITLAKEEIKKQDVKDRELYRSMLKFAKENRAKRAMEAKQKEADADNSDGREKESDDEDEATVKTNGN